MSTVGSCPDGYDVLSSKTDCEGAAQVMTLADIQASTTYTNSIPGPEFPPGCWYKEANSAGQLLWFNSDLSSTGMAQNTGHVAICRAGHYVP